MRQQVALHGKDNRISGVDPVPPGRWEYEGTADPFLNGWQNAGGGLQEFRWRRTNENQTEIQGFIQGGTANPVINLPDPYRPAKIQPAIGYDSAGNILLWKLYPNGDLTIDATAVAVSGTAIVNAGGLIYEYDNTDGWLSVTSAGFGGPENRGIALISDTDVYLKSNNGSVYTAALVNPTTFDVTSDNTLTLSSITLDASSLNVSTNDITLTSQNGDIELNINTAGKTFIINDSSTSAMFQLTDGGQALLRTDSVQIEATGAGNTIALGLPSGGSFTVYDSSAGQIMRLDEDGTLHLLSGASIVYDL